jgi:hypothetical protein
VIEMMDDNNLEQPKEQAMSNELNEESVQIFDYVNKNEYSFDVDGLMRMASNILQDEFLMDSVKEMSQMIQLPLLYDLSEKFMETDWIVVSKEEMDMMVRELSEAKEELAQSLERSRKLQIELEEEKAKK